MRDTLETIQVPDQTSPGPAAAQAQAAPAREPIPASPGEAKPFFLAVGGVAAGLGLLTLAFGLPGLTVGMVVMAFVALGLVLLITRGR